MQMQCILYNQIVSKYSERHAECGLQDYCIVDCNCCKQNNVKHCLTRAQFLVRGMKSNLTQMENFKALAPQTKRANCAARVWRNQGHLT